jgi:hypothetical protein
MRWMDNPPINPWQGDIGAVEEIPNGEPVVA